MRRGRTDMDVWSSLTWDDLEQWAGSRSVARGRAYQRQNRVRDFGVGDDNRLLATVTGTRPYVVTVRHESRGRGRSIRSECTCPVGENSCKHAVAAVVSLLEVLGEAGDVPRADPDDPRWDELLGHDELEPESPRTAQGPSSRPNQTDWDETIRAYLRSQSVDELADLAWSLAERFPEVRAEFRERIALSEGDVGRLVAQARRELREVTSIEPWRSGWTGEGVCPDYTRLKHRLERLTRSGHHDEVVALGRELIRDGIEQVGRSDDEGDTAAALSECLPIVFDAVTRSSLTGPGKLLFTIDAHLEDEYEVIGEAADAVLGADHPPADWSVVADVLAGRLKQTTLSGSRRHSSVNRFLRDYERDRMSNWLLDALRRAGRQGELLSIYETEARATSSYQRLVEYLIEEGHDDEALRWARQGIEKNPQEYPGIASRLAESLCELARRRKQWPIVAAHIAWRFFKRPGVQAFEELCAAARKARCLRAVRRAALHFLETGCCPITVTEPEEGNSGVNVEESWPLPVPDELVFLMHQAVIWTKPSHDVLLDMAIADKRPDDALRWYDRMLETSRGSGRDEGWRVTQYTDRVAAAVAQSHPERTLAIYERAVDAHLKEAKPSAYEAIGSYLRKTRPILDALGRESEWKQRIAGLRQDYRRRPRFIEVLDTVEGRTIMQTRKSRSGN